MTLSQTSFGTFILADYIKHYYSLNYYSILTIVAANF